MQTIKCVLVGNHEAHQRELLVRYTIDTSTIPSEYVPAAFDNYSQTVVIDGKPCILGLFDTVGLDDYDRLRPLSYPYTDIFLVLFSVGHPSSLEDALTKFLPEIKHHCPETPFLLVGTRTDLRNRAEDHGDFKGTGASCLPSYFGPFVANGIGAVMYKECAAFTGEGIKDVMDHAVRAALNLKNTCSQGKLSGYVPSLLGMDHEWRRVTAGAVTLFSDLGNHKKQVILERAVSLFDNAFLGSVLYSGSGNDLLTAKNQKRLALVASARENYDFLRLLFSSGFEAPIRDWGKRYQVWTKTSLGVDEIAVDKATVTSKSYQAGKTLHILAVGQNADEVSKLPSALPISQIHTLVLANCAGIPSFSRSDASVNLESLIITNCNLDQIPQWVSNLPKLTMLSLSKTNMKELPSYFSQLSSTLEILCIRNNKLQNLPNSLGNFKMLRVLNVDNNDLRELPNHLGDLTRLEVLTLCNNKLRELPLSLGLLMRSLHTLHWSGNPLKFPSQRFLSTASTTETLGHLKSFMEETVFNNQVKLALVGQEGAGKSTLVEAVNFKRDWRFNSVANPEKTDGVEISSADLHNYHLKIFDLAGDVEYLKTHMLFLSDNNLFLTVFDMSQYVVGTITRSVDHLGRLELWLKTIQSQAPGCHTIITATHADHPMLSEEMKQVIRQHVCKLLANYRAHHLFLYKDDYVAACFLCNGSLLTESQLGDTRSFVCLPPEASSEQESEMLVYCIPHVVGYYEVGSKEQYPKDFITSNNPSIKKLKKGLKKSIEFLFKSQWRSTIPQKWAMIREKVQQIVEIDSQLYDEPVLRFQEIEKLANDYHILSDLVPAMMNFFHCQGDFLWYSNIPQMRESVIIQPTWLSLMLRKLISFRSDVQCISDGILSHTQLPIVWQSISESTRDNLLALLRRSGLCFLLSESEELFPCNLPIGWPDADIWPPVPSKSELQLTYDFDFSFLPPSFFSDVTVEIHKKKRLSFPSNIKPVYYRFHVVYLTKTRGVCSIHEELMNTTDEVSDVQVSGKPKSSTLEDLHRVYLEVTPHNNTLKVVVRGLQPCCVMSEIQDIVADVHLTRHKGVEYLEYVVCPQCELNRVRNPARFALSSVIEPVCSRGHALGCRVGILTGNSCKPSQATSPELARLGRIVGDTLEDHYCPKLFVVLPIQTQSMSLKDRIVYSYLRDGFALHLLCECPGQWHFIDSPGFRISKPKEFFEVHGTRVCKLLKVISVLQGPMIAAATVDPHFQIGAGIVEQAGSLARDLETLLENYFDRYPELKSSCRGSVEEDLKYLKTATKLQRSELARFLDVASKGREFGPLVCTFVEKYNEWLWLCEEHNQQFEIVER